MTEQSNRRTPIVIGGAHRSGTTLFRRILNGHSRIYCPPEVKLYKDLLGQYPSDPLSHTRLGASLSCLDLPRDTWLDEFGRAFVRCMEIAMANHGKQRWADKSPENAINIRHWHRLLKGELCFVLIVRNPLDIVASMDEIKMNKVLPTSIEGRAEHIIEYIGCGLSYCDEFPERSTIVAYEDLVLAPAKTMQRVLAAVGEEFESAMLDNLDAIAQGTGLEDPKARGRSTVSAASVGRWTRDLRPEDARMLKRRFGDALGRLGYDYQE